MSKMVMGWRVASEIVLSAMMVLLLIEASVWFNNLGVGLTKVGTEPLLERVIFYAMGLSGLFALIWLLAWQRVELNAKTSFLRLANINTAYRWRALNAGEVTRITYSSPYKALGRMTLHCEEGTPPLTMLEDSYFAFRPSRRLRVIAAFVVAHNPDAEIAAALTSSSANQSGQN